MKKPILYRFLILGIFLFCGFALQAHRSKNDTTIHVVADKMPTFPGGARARTAFLGTHLRYPVAAIKNHITGRVFVTFVVERNGSVSNIRVLKGIGYGCDKEAMRVASEMPKWIPGRIKKKTVRVRVTLPFLFNLQPQNKVYTQVDKYPVFDYKHGLKPYLEYHIRYPVGIVRNKRIDTVKVFFIVEPDKRITHVTVKKDTGKLDAYDYEAMRLAKDLKIAQPAYVKQYPVRMWLYLPVIFNYKKVDTTTFYKTDTLINGKKYSYYHQGKVYVLVDHMPSFPGGDKSLMQYLAKHIRYPEKAKKLHQQGRVFLHFIVEGDGTITHITVLRGVSTSLDSEAVWVIENMPKWNPGSLRGKPVRVSYNLPVKFTLE